MEIYVCFMAEKTTSLSSPLQKKRISWLQYRNGGFCLCNNIKCFTCILWMIIQQVGRYGDCVILAMIGCLSKHVILDTHCINTIDNLLTITFCIT